MPAQNGHNSGMRHQIKIAVGEHRLNRFPLHRRAVLQRMDYGQRGLAFAQIASHGLAQGLFGRGQGEKVVDKLERHAQVRARTQPGFSSAPRYPGQKLIQPYGNLKQAGGLAIDQFEM